jgi:hypothetical protein
VTVPGLGSFLARRRIAGAAQVLLAITGNALSVWWFVQFLRQWAEDGYLPTDGGPHFAIGLTGVGVFAVAWVWSLLTSLWIVRASRSPE